MEIKLSEEQLQAAIDGSVAKAIQSALGGYSVQNAISEKITNEVINGAIGEALSEALLAIDKTVLVTKLAEQIHRSTTAAVCHLVVNGMTEVIMKMRGKSEYSEGYKTEREALLVQLKGTI